MIPNNLIARLQSMQFNTVNALLEVAPISGDPPPFNPGDTFFARIIAQPKDAAQAKANPQAASNTATYTARVNQQLVQVQLNQPANTGQVLQLRVTGVQDGAIQAERVITPEANRVLTEAASEQSNPTHTSNSTPTSTQVTLSQSAKAVNATPTQQSDASAEANQQASSQTRLSQTGRTIADLFANTTQNGKGIPALSITQSAVLAANSSQPAQIASALQQTLSNSGLFYESQLARWAQGAIGSKPLEQQPHAAHVVTTTTQAQGVQEHAAQPNAGSAADSIGKGIAQRETATQVTSQTLQEQSTHDIPAELKPLVQNQLHSLSSQQVQVQLTLWPGVEMHWQIDDPERHAQQHDRQQSAQGGNEPNELWKSDLRLSFPRLGNMQASFEIQGDTVSLALKAAPDAAREMAPLLTELKQAFANAGLQVNALNLAVGESDAAVTGTQANG